METLEVSGKSYSVQYVVEDYNESRILTVIIKWMDEDKEKTHTADISPYLAPNELVSTLRAYIRAGMPPRDPAITVGPWTLETLQKIKPKPSEVDFITL